MMNTTNKHFEWRNYTLYFAWIVSMIATLGSLFFSEILGFIPCELCWYQRIMMYPLCIILGIATFYNEKNMKNMYYQFLLSAGVFHFITMQYKKSLAFQRLTRACKVSLVMSIILIG